MDPLTLVLLGLGGFWLAFAALRARGLVPESLSIHGPIVMWRTGRARALLDRLARPRRLWRAWGNFGLGLALVVMAASVAFLVTVAVLTVRQPPEPSAVTRPQNALIIPGYNQFLPLSAAPEIVAGLAVALVVHEGGHGILSRAGDIEVKSVGLVFLTLLPIAAFVEPDEDSQEEASRGDRTRMFAAGVTNNFAVTAVAFALLFGPVVGSLSVVSGAAVAGSFAGSSAAEAGIDRGDVIVSVGEENVTSNADLERALRRVESQEVTVGLRDGDPVVLERSLTVVDNRSDSLETGLSALPDGATIVAINGSGVDTLADFDAAVADRTHAELLTADGTTASGAVGAHVTVVADGALADAGASTGSLVVTRVNGTRTASGSALQATLGETRPGQTVTVEAVGASGRATYDVDLGEGTDDHGYLGVFVTNGYSGVAVDDVGVQTYPAGSYLSVLGGSCPDCPTFALSFVERSFFALQLPLAGVTGGDVLPYNFAGFTTDVTGFYEPTGALGWLGGWLFAVANLLFWTAWINLNLGFFNCIPTFLLDGGHIFRSATEAVVARLPLEDGKRVVTAATVGVQAVMLGSLFLLLFGAQLLG